MSWFSYLCFGCKCSIHDFNVVSLYFLSFSKRRMEIILDLKIETSSCVVYVFIPILCLVTFKFIFDLIAYPQENDLQAL